MTNTKNGELVDFTEVKAALVTKRAVVRLMTDEQRIARVAVGLKAFAEMDATHAGLCLQMGEMAYKFLQLPLAEQEGVVTMLAAAMDLEAPSYEGAVTGRSQLAAVIYGSRPELVKVKRGDKDSLAGKRLSQYMRLYRIEAGLLSLPAATKKRVKKGIPVATMKKATGWLMSVMENEEEVAVLVEWMGRLGFEEEKVESWGVAA